MKRLPFFQALAILLTIQAYAIIPEAEDMIKKEFKGATTYSHKPDYAKSVSDVFLAYDKDGNVIYGAAARVTTPWKFTAITVIKKEGDAYKIVKAEFPNKESMKYYDKKKVKVAQAIEDATGVIVDKAGKENKIDAVAGATKYHKRLYAGFNLLAKKVVEEMKKNPAWEKKPLE